jgi:hypothetical protein
MIADDFNDLPDDSSAHHKTAGRPKIEMDLAMLEKLAMIQCTDVEIAATMGFSVDTLQNRKNDTPAVVEALDRGRAKGRSSLRRLQWQRATGGSDTMCIWLGKQILGQRDRNEITGDGGGAVVLQIISGVDRGEAEK